MKRIQFLTFLVTLLLISCGTLEIGIERKPDSTATVNVLPAEKPISTAPSIKPSSATADVPLTEAITRPKATLATPPPTPGQQFMDITIYLIAINDNGQSGQLVGCGDSVIPVQVETNPTKEVLRTSLEKLLALKEQFYGESGLYNALYQSDLEVDRITLENGKTEIFLTGTLMLGGVCDNPRVEAQLESTVLEFSNVQEVSIFINGIPLKEALSLQG